MVDVQYAWLMLISYGIVRMLIPFFSKQRDLYMLNTNLEEKEADYYMHQRSQMITLASFVLVTIAIIIALPRGSIPASLIPVVLDSLFYLSIGMASAFVASYMFVMLTNRWWPHGAETLEYMSIMSTGLGLLKLTEFVTDDQRIFLVYILFFVGILGISAYDLLFNKRFFYDIKEK